MGIRIPSLRRHKPSAQGVVTINGKDIYLGPWPLTLRKPPPDVKSAYDAKIAEWLPPGRVGTPGDECPAVTLATLLAAFWEHVQKHYVNPDGRPTGEQEEYKMALRPVRHLYEALPVADFSPLKLKAVR